MVDDLQRQLESDKSKPKTRESTPRKCKTTNKLVVSEKVLPENFSDLFVIPIFSGFTQFAQLYLNEDGNWVQLKTWFDKVRNGDIVGLSLDNYQIPQLGKIALTLVEEVMYHHTVNIAREQLVCRLLQPIRNILTLIGFKNCKFDKRLAAMIESIQSSSLTIPQICAELNQMYQMEGFPMETVNFKESAWEQFQNSMLWSNDTPLTVSIKPQVN